MADRQEILAQAAKLGQVIGTDPAVKNFRELSRQLELDVGARDLLQQFQQLVEQLSYKEQMGQSISMPEKSQFESLQQSLKIHPLLQKIGVAQKEYTDLMQLVQEQVNKGVSGAPADAAASIEAPKPASKIILES